MASAPGIEFLPVEEQQLFAQEFQKDVEFIQLLILLVGKSCATGSVDITWADVQDGVRQVIGTTQAARSSCSRYLQWTRKDPSQRFCNIFSGCGRRAAVQARLRTHRERHQSPELCGSGRVGKSLPVAGRSAHSRGAPDALLLAHVGEPASGRQRPRRPADSVLIGTRIAMFDGVEGRLRGRERCSAAYGCSLGTRPRSHRL